MSKVKWVLHTNLTAHELQYANGSPMGKQIPVIPLADLGELVEGLKANMQSVPPENRNGYAMGLTDLQRLLAQLEAYTQKEQA